jgi:hypothetical protein
MIEQGKEESSKKRIGAHTPKNMRDRERVAGARDTAKIERVVESREDVSEKVVNPHTAWTPQTKHTIKSLGGTERKVTTGVFKAHIVCRVNRPMASG